MATSGSYRYRSALKQRPLLLGALPQAASLQPAQFQPLAAPEPMTGFGERSRRLERPLLGHRCRQPARRESTKYGHQTTSDERLFVTEAAVNAWLLSVPSMRDRHSEAAPLPSHSFVQERPNKMLRCFSLALAMDRLVPRQLSPARPASAPYRNPRSILTLGRQRTPSLREPEQLYESRLLPRFPGVGCGSAIRPQVCAVHHARPREPIGLRQFPVDLAFAAGRVRRTRRQAPRRPSRATPPPSLRSLRASNQAPLTNRGSELPTHEKARSRAQLPLEALQPEKPTFCPRHMFAKFVDHCRGDVTNFRLRQQRPFAVASPNGSKVPPSAVPGRCRSRLVGVANLYERASAAGKR